MNMNVKMNAPAETVPVDALIKAATDAILREQRPDGHWVYELEADATIPAEYVLLTHFLGEEPNLELEKKIGVYLRRIQGEHGGWPLYHKGALDISATVKAYFALKMIGDDPEAPHMKRAREEILKRGGAGKANVFTRIQLALYGDVPWSIIPTIPPELILLPRWFPIHLSKMSYWARTVIVPLLVLAAKQPIARNPRGVHVKELFLPGKVASKRAAHQKWIWSAFFGALDWVLKRVEPFWPQKLRAHAIKTCMEWTTERLNGEDGLGAIYPAMANSVMMYDTLGVGPEDPRRAIARVSVEKLLVIKEDEAYCQPCVSPVWDTGLVCHALMETRDPKVHEAVTKGLEWLKPLQVLDVKGDWAEEKPGVRPGGWAFQYRNDYYPDLDDTAVVVMALDRAKEIEGQKSDYSEAISRGREWVEGLQSKNGGWGAFDADNSYYYLNNIPFADHGALLDPPTEDVSGRCIGMLAQLGEANDTPRMKAAIEYLEKVQMPDGSWFGRWGVNYIYGTWSALAGLNAAGIDHSHPMIRKAVDWLVTIQNEDGGWGEDCDSYKLEYKGYEKAPSIASQTAWALLGLMAAGEVDHPAVARGVRWLEANQGADGLWPQEYYTGGGFPRVFYLRYHGYPKFFPLWALARYRNLKTGNSRKVGHGL
ncbi:squalene-hopene/tetraprenyl-beta-curcumene cyclase [Rhizomicrobium palustre]|uniref:Squalene-hopene/tetraprenyl-beta-curcumene cyclase n=2 Tax=Rhizomicrobium palustre TaxID=189966 RepID=A0A846N0V4_9PROT|nr:squalene--hopene cyclase [Rhizomicrobium palustre]NIK88800.1 squalene-hopene/tetraprenyl-beta-curcumene cyclase [Rhizomicrobium palustre]